MLLAEKNDSLLMKNHQSRPINSQPLPLPEANTSIFRGPNHRNQNKGCDKSEKPKPEIKGR